MSFDIRNYVAPRNVNNSMSSNSTVGIGLYSTEDDDLATVLEDGYFNDVNTTLHVKDVLLVTTTDAIAWVFIIGLTPNVIAKDLAQELPPGSVSEEDLDVALTAKVNRIKHVERLTLTTGGSPTLVHPVANAVVGDPIDCSINFFGTAPITNVSADVTAPGEVTFKASSGVLLDTIVTFVIYNP